MPLNGIDDVDKECSWWIKSNVSVFINLSLTEAKGKAQRNVDNNDDKTMADALRVN